MKKIFTLLWGLSIVALSAISYTFAYTQEQQEAYQWAYKYGITTQPTIEAAKLDGNITRQAFAKMVVNYLENYAKITSFSRGDCNFTDESKITSDLRIYARKTCSYNIMWKNWTKFNPTQSLDKAQLWTVLSRILWWDEYNSTGKWYYIYHLNALKFNGIMDNIDNPTSYVKRWDVFVMLKKIGDKYGSNVYMNGAESISAYNTDTISSLVVDSDDSDYNIPSNAIVVYTWKDGSAYYYNADFLKVLKDTAEKKWESDLVKYVDIELKNIDAVDQFTEFDPDKFSEEIWIDFDSIDKDKLTKKEKEEIAKKFKTWVKNVLDEAIKMSDKEEDDLNKVVKNIKNDKFWLKEKYEKTKEYNEIWKTFVSTYCEIMGNLLETALTAENPDEDPETMAQVFSLLWASLIYQSGTESYQKYLAERSVNTIKLLGWELIQ